MKIEIVVNVGLTPGLENFLTGLMGGQGSRPAPRVEKDVPPTAEELQAKYGDQNAVDLQQRIDAVDPQPEAQRRTRRTKAQIAADEAAAASDTNASGAQNLLAEVSSTADGQNSGPTATTDASPSDLATALEQAEAPVADGAITIDTVKAAISQAMGIQGQSPKTVMTALQTGIGEHAKSAGALKPEEYPAAMVILNKIIAGG